MTGGDSATIASAMDTSSLLRRKSQMPRSCRFQKHVRVDSRRKARSMTTRHHLRASANTVASHPQPKTATHRYNALGTRLQNLCSRGHPKERSALQKQVT